MERIVYQARVDHKPVGKGKKSGPKYKQGERFFLTNLGGYVTLTRYETWPRGQINIYANNFAVDFDEVGYVNEQARN